MMDIANINDKANEEYEAILNKLYFMNYYGFMDVIESWGKDNEQRSANMELPSRQRTK